MTAPLLTYEHLYFAMKWIFCLFIALAVLVELYAWRPRKTRSAWRAMRIDAKPEPDGRSSIENFAKIIPKEPR